MAKQLETDVVVVAAGLSGLAAAISAAENGASVIALEKASNTGGAANMGMGPCAAGSPVQKASMIEVTPGELFRRHMFYTHYQVDPRLVRAYYFKSGDTIQWLMDMGVKFNSVRPAFRARERTRAYADGEYTWHVVQPEDGSEPGPRAATTMTKRMTERAQALGVEFMFETPGKELITNDEGAVTGVKAVDKNGEEIDITAKAVIVATGGFGANAKMIKDYIGLDWGKNLYSFAVPGMDGDGFNMCHKVGAGHTPVTMEMMYQLPDNMNHFYVEGGFRQPCYWCDRNGERFMPEDDIFNTTFVGNAINHLPGKVGFSILTQDALNTGRKDGPDIVSHVHPRDSTSFEEQFARRGTPTSTAMATRNCQGRHARGACREDRHRPRGPRQERREHNAICAEGWDSLFEKEREFMMPLENGLFYARRQYVGASSTLGGVLINQRMEVMTDEYKTIPACTAYRRLHHLRQAHHSIPGNTMGFCLNSGRIAENAAALSMESASDDEWD